MLSPDPIATNGDLRHKAGGLGVVLTAGPVPYFHRGCPWV